MGSFPNVPKLFVYIHIYIYIYFFFFPQELLSHSSDRPEKQQLKEALEAMQVREGRAAVGLRWARGATEHRTPLLLYNKNLEKPSHSPREGSISSFGTCTCVLLPFDVISSQQVHRHRWYRPPKAAGEAGIC